MSDEAIAWVVAPLMVALFATLWLIVGYAITKLTAWADLERLFPDRPDAPIAGSLHFQGAYIGRETLGPSYRGCMTYRAGPEGFRLSIWKVFAPFAKPIFVPFDAVTVETVSLRLFTMCRLKLGPHGEIWLTIAPSVARELARLSKGAFAVQPEMK
ncbi:MAG: hypothetical protein AAFR88_13675 [Pseudomonadota bacterium]